jgi:hypothetical protein
MNYGRVSLGHLALALIETKRGLAHQALSAAKIDLAFIHEALLSAVTVSTSA